VTVNSLQNIGNLSRSFDSLWQLFNNSWLWRRDRSIF